VTVTETVEVPAAVGVPVIPPLLLIDNPAGNPVAVHVYGDTPPMAPTEAVYAVPTVPDGREVVVIFNAGALTTRVNEAVAVSAGVELSVTFRETLAVPAAVGVPVIVEPLTLNPAGRPVALKMYGAVPPLAVSVAEYATPTVPALSDVVPTVRADPMTSG
jgi:hypothetical protein